MVVEKALAAASLNAISDAIAAMVRSHQELHGPDTDGQSPNITGRLRYAQKYSDTPDSRRFSGKASVNIGATSDSLVKAIRNIATIENLVRGGLNPNVPQGQAELLIGHAIEALGRSENQVHYIREGLADAKRYLVLGGRSLLPISSDVIGVEKLLAKAAAEIAEARHSIILQLPPRIETTPSSPPYLHIAAALQDDIYSGKLQDNEPLLNWKIARAHNVTGKTAFKAALHLNKLGLVQVHTARTAVVSSLPPRTAITPPIPGHLHIATALQDDIHSGQFPPGQPFPSGSEIAAEHGVSRDIADRAVKQLEELGLVQVHTGRTTVVSSLPPKAEIISPRLSYLRVSAALQKDVRSRKSMSGAAFPSIRKIVETYDVGRVTAEQAVHHLERLGVIGTGTSSMPKYLRLATALRDDIQASKLPRNGPMPLRKIMERHAANNTTAKRAVHHLEWLGFIRGSASSSMPKYLEISAALRDDIYAGRLPSGGLLLSKKELAVEHDVSTTTASRAIAHLKNFGIIEAAEPAPPKYLQIATTLQDDIYAGRFPPGEPLPSGEEIAAEHGASFATANRAVHQLQELGLVQVHITQTTVVSSLPPRIAITPPVPPYLQIAAALQDDIYAGRFPPGEPLPSGEEIAAEQGVSRDIANRAVHQLQELGLVQVHTGRTTVRLRTTDPSAASRPPKIRITPSSRKYLQVAAALQQNIDASELPGGEPAPSIQKIMQQYSVAHATAQQAIRHLEEVGVIRAAKHPPSEHLRVAAEIRGAIDAGKLPNSIPSLIDIMGSHRISLGTAWYVVQLLKQWVQRQEWNPLGRYPK